MRISALDVFVMTVWCVLVFVVRTAVAQVDPTPAVAESLGVQQQVLGAVPGERQMAPANFRISFQLPTMEQFAPAKVKGGGEVIYYLQGTSIRVPGGNLPQLTGFVPVSKEMPTPPRLIVSGAPQSMVEVRWGVGRDILCHGLGVMVDVRDPVTDASIVSVQKTGIELTTGTVTVGGKPVAGEVSIEKQQIHFVGTFPMPETGHKQIDAIIAGQPVLMHLVVASRPLQ